jgi:Double zinc ribbon
MVNCPQCQAPNQQNSAFCASCGAQLAPAEAPAAASGYGPPGQGASVGYGSSAGYSAPAGYGPPSYGPAGQAPPTGQYSPAGQYPPPGQMPPAGYQQPGGQFQPRQGGTTPAFQFDLKRLTRSDQVVGIASFIVLISIFLPWFSVSVRDFGSATGSGTAAHGWLWLVFVLDLLIIGYLVMRAGWEESPVRMPFSHERLLMAATGLQLLLILIAFFDMPSSDGLSGVSVGWAWGAFIGLLAALAAAAPIVPAVRARLEQRR